MMHESPTIALEQASGSHCIAAVAPRDPMRTR